MKALVYRGARDGQENLGEGVDGADEPAKKGRIAFDCGEFFHPSAR